MPDPRVLAVTEPLPPVVYLPCSRHVTDPADAEIDMRQTRDGRTAVLAYSALDRLKACCGDNSPWIVAPSTFLDDIQSIHQFDLVALDVDIPQELRQAESR